MLNPFNPQNPDWLQKSIGDLQTAIEMNDVIGAFKANALVLQNLISKINPELVLSTESQIISNSINELKQLIDSFIGFNISEKSLTNGQSFLFPAMSKGEAFVIRIFEYDGSSQEGIPSPNGVVWLGGYGGVGVGDGSMVICLTNSPGGTYNDVGHNFAIINQGKDSEVIFVDELPDENLARTGVIYVLNSNNAMYVWDQQLGDYVLVGDVIPGTLISITEFIDENNNVVIPESNKLYLDTTAEEYYRWDGVQYVSIKSNDFEHLDDQKYVKYDESTGRFESGKITETSEGIDVNGKIKTQAVELENETGTPLPNQITRNGNKPKYTDSAGVTKGLVRVHTSVLTDKIAVMTADDEIKPATFPLDNVVKVYGENESGTAVHTEVVQYKAVDNSLTPPTILELIEHDAERVDYPNLNRIYMKCGTVWGYIELNAI